MVDCGIVVWEIVGGRVGGILCCAGIGICYEYRGWMCDFGDIDIECSSPSGKYFAPGAGARIQHPMEMEKIIFQLR